MVGISPSNPISETLYKRTATNAWKQLYTPLPYPHSLRQEACCPSDTAAHPAPARFDFLTDGQSSVPLKT